MTEPLVPFGRNPAAGSPPPGEPEPMERLIENIARLIDRLHPPGSEDIPPGLSGATARLRRSLRENHTNAASHAILALKEVLNEVESLRERTLYLEAASAKAFSELNTTEHRLRELNGHIDQVWAVLAQAAALPEIARQIASDALAEPAQRIATLRAALEAAPATGGSLADQVRTLRERAAALRKDHGRTSEDDLRQRHEAEIAELNRRHEAALNASRDDADHARAELADQLADARRELALIDAERAHLRANTNVAQERLTALERRLETHDSTSIAREREEGEAQARLEGELAAVRALASDLEQRLAVAEADLAEREADAEGAAALHTHLSEAENQRDAAERERDQLLTNLEQTQQERDRCARELVTAQAQIEDLERELAQSASDRHRAVRECDDLRERLQQAAHVAADTAANQAAAEASALREQLAGLEAEREAETAALAALRQDLATVRAERDRSGRAAGALAITLRDRNRDLARILHRFGTLATTVANLDQTPDAQLTAARQHLTSAAAAIDADDSDESVAAALRSATALDAAVHASLAQIAERLDTATADAAAAHEQQTAMTAVQRERELARQRADAAEQATHAALARASEAEAAHQTQAELLEQQTVRLAALDDELRTAQTELAHARAAADAAAEAERALRSEGQERLAATEQAQRHAATAAQAAEQEAQHLRKRLAQIIDQVAAVAEMEIADDAGEPSIEPLLRAIAERQEALDDERRAALSEAQRHAAEVTTLTARIAELQQEHSAVSSSTHAAETARRAAEQQARQSAEERDQARATAETRARELAEARHELAAAGADLDSLRVTIGELEAKLNAATETERERERLREALAAAEAEAAAADERIAGLLAAVKALGHTANEAIDQVGVALPLQSRHLTRATARIERAEQGADLTVAIANARTVCERAAAQCESLAAALTGERQAHRTALAERDQARGTTDRLTAEVTALTQRLDEIDALRTALTTAQSDGERLQAELTSLEAARAETAADSDRRIRAARAEADDLAARLAATQSEMADLHDALRRATQGGGSAVAAVRDEFEARITELEAALAEAQGRADSLVSGLDARDDELTRLRADLDRMRAGNGDVLGYQARLRSLTTKLNSTVAEAERLRSEREQDAERLTSVTELERRIERLSTERQEAAVALRSAEEALAEQRTKATELARRLERSERDWKRRLAAADDALATERERADQASARLHSELAARGSRSKPTSP